VTTDLLYFVGSIKKGTGPAQLTLTPPGIRLIGLIT
jgi:hypothetical protein